MTLHIHQYVGKRLHMIGIGGSSMSGLAVLLQKADYHITGSDNYASASVLSLRESGIPVTIGHFAENVHDVDLVIYSAAIADDNPERLEATRLMIPQMERSTLLGQLMQGYAQAVCISGTHGKTTTTAMVAQILLQANVDPTVHIGGNFAAIGGSTRIGSKKVFVAEACEFHLSFLQMQPSIAVVLNIEADHLDYFHDIDHITAAFKQFVSLVPAHGFMIGNGDDERVVSLLQSVPCQTISYGVSAHNRMQPINLAYSELGHASFDAVLDGTTLTHVTLQVGGDYNMRNALAAIACAHVLGINMGSVAEALHTFSGVHRRFEHTGTVAGVKLYHDYGHNPVEMRGALSVAKKQPHQKLWAVVQPHTYSRLKLLFDDYIYCCEDADEILITDIYAAREKDPGDIHSQMLVDAIAKTNQNVHYTPTFNDTEAYLRAHWQPGDLVITMGCGNINELNDQIAKHSPFWDEDE